MESCTFDEPFELVQELIKSNSLGTHYIGICRLPHERWNLMADHSHSCRFLKMFDLCFAKAAHLQCLERWLISSTRRWLSGKAKVTELIGCKSANKSAGGEGIKKIDRGFVYICFGLWQLPSGVIVEWGNKNALIWLSWCLVDCWDLFDGIASKFFNRKLKINKIICFEPNKSYVKIWKY